MGGRVSLQVNIQLREIYKILCGRCKKKLKKLVQEKVAEQLAEQLLEDRTGEKK